MLTGLYSKGHQGYSLRMKSHLIIALLALPLTLAGCSTATHDGPPRHEPDLSAIPNAVPRALPKSRYGNRPSYTVAGKTYHVLASSKGYDKRGIASWYGKKFHGRLTSTREPYDMFAMTAASPDLPIPTFVRVTNLQNGRQAIVKVNDRGPFVGNRVIDLSYAAAKKLGYARQGTTRVEVTALNTGAEPIPSHQTGLYLQVASFHSKAQANAALSAAQSLSWDNSGEVEVAHLSGNQWYRVFLGPLHSAGESDKLIADLQSRGYPGAFTVIR